MNHLLAITCLLAATGGAVFAQSLPTANLNKKKDEKATPSKTNQVDIPLWLQELSNMSAEKRNEYTRAFSDAKQAYAAAHLAECEAHLNTCELIYNGNPNVWSLRASLLIAQKRFDAAEPLLEKVLEEQPDDSITLFNRSLLNLGKGDYEKCLELTRELLDDVRYTESMQLLHSLRYRVVLCLLMLDRLDEAKAEIADLTPLDDSPLYYYSQAAIWAAKGDAVGMLRDISAADRIYAREKYLLSYKQNLYFSKLQEKFLNRAGADPSDQSNRQEEEKEDVRPSETLLH